MPRASRTVAGWCSSANMHTGRNDASPRGVYLFQDDYAPSSGLMKAIIQRSVPRAWGLGSTARLRRRPARLLHLPAAPCARDVSLKAGTRAEQSCRRVRGSERDQKSLLWPGSPAGRRRGSLIVAHPRAPLARIPPWVATGGLTLSSAHRRPARGASRELIKAPTVRVRRRAPAVEPVIDRNPALILRFVGARTSGRGEASRLLTPSDRGARRGPQRSGSVRCASGWSSTSRPGVPWMSIRTPWARFRGRRAARPLDREALAFRARHTRPAPSPDTL